MGIHVYSQTQIKIDTATIKFHQKKSVFVVYAKCTDITTGETQFMYEQLVLYATWCFDPLSWCMDV